MLCCLEECPGIHATTRKKRAEIETTPTSEMWEDISELWFIAIQGLLCCYVSIVLCTCVSTMY